MSQSTGLVPEEGRGMRRGGRVAVLLNTGSESFVHQSFKDESDINLILKKYERDKAISWLSKYEGRFDDVASVPDFHAAQNQVIAAQKMFDDLPASVRDRFQNDPGKFLDFATSPENVDELVKMGLATKVQKPGDVVETPPPVKPEPPVKPA